MRKISKHKCPACGSKDIIKILYGMPSYEAHLASEKGELMLGGCCISDINPNKHCKSCGKDFASKDMFYLLGMTSFEFFLGGYFGPSHFIYIDGKQENKIIRYAKAHGGIYVDLKDPKNEMDLNPDILIKEISLKPEEWFGFIEELKSVEIDNWKDKYIDKDILDGIQWEIIIEFNENDKIKKYGSNKYPPYWSKFIKTIKYYVGEDIK